MVFYPFGKGPGKKAYRSRAAYESAAGRFYFRHRKPTRNGTVPSDFQILRMWYSQPGHIENRKKLESVLRYDFPKYRINQRSKRAIIKYKAAQAKAEIKIAKRQRGRARRMADMKRARERKRK